MYDRHQISRTTPQIALSQNQVMQLFLQNDSLQATVGNTSNKVFIQKEPLTISIIADEAQQPEVRYLKAALVAIQDYTQLPIKISSDTTAFSWLFWLKATPIPESIKQQVQHGANLWVQPGTKPEIVNTSFTSMAPTEVKVHQVSAPEENAAQTNGLWIAANSHAILTEKLLGQGKVYTFRSGFSPAWSDLGRSAQLPELLLPILYPAPNASFYDLRALDEQQLFPLGQVSLSLTSSPESPQKSLIPWLVLAAFVLFLIERLFANRRIKV